jgi:hypothetical protein
LNTQELRRGALETIVSCALSSDLATASRAVSSLAEALAGPIPFGNGKIPPKDIQGWIPDHLHTLEQISHIVTYTSHALVHLQIRNVLAWHARNGASTEVQQAAKSIISIIPNEFEFRLVCALINSYEEFMLLDSEDIETAVELAQARREEHVRSLAAEFIERYPDPREGADVIDERMRWGMVLRAGLELDPAQLLTEMCRLTPEYGVALSRIAIVEPDRPIRKCLHSMILAMRELDRDQAVGLMDEALATDNKELLTTIAFAIRFCGRIWPEDIIIIRKLLDGSDPQVKGQAIHALRRIGQDDPSSAVALARSVEIGSSNLLAEALFGVFDVQHGVDPTLIEEAAASDLLDMLTV